MPLNTTKKVKLDLVGLDSNAFSLLGAFQRQAKKEDWSKEEIADVRKEAMKGDYDHLLRTLMDVCEDSDESPAVEVIDPKDGDDEE